MHTSSSKSHHNHHNNNSSTTIPAPSSSPSPVAPLKVLLSIMFFGFFVVAIFSFSAEDFHIRKDYDHDRAIKGINRQKQEQNLKLLHQKNAKQQQQQQERNEQKKSDEEDDHAATIEAGTNKKVWDEYSFSSSHDKEKLHPDKNNNKKTTEATASTETTTTVKPTSAKKIDSDDGYYRFELDKPRAPDEEAFFHRPKSQGGVLLPLPSRPSSSSKSLPIVTDRDGEPHQQHQSAAESSSSSWTNETFTCAEHLHKMFSLFDANEAASDSIAVYGTMCVGRDCEFIIPMIENLDVAIGHFIVVLSTSTARFVDLFSALMKQFPGRFTVFHRPEKLSCAESWNLVTRMGFARVKPMPEQIFIANADWHPVPSPGVKRNMARFLEFSRRNLDKVLNRYYHFSSFAFTKKGYLELGYFDEVIYPALAEDVEFHLKAVSKGMGTLGLYDNWRTGSKHIHRASAGEKTIQKRHGSVARFDYILRKWGIRVPSYTDFARAPAYRHPFNLPWMHHNNSWVVDPKHRECAKTGEGRKFKNSNRCFYDAKVLLKNFPEEGTAGVGGAIIGRDDGLFKIKKHAYSLPSQLTTDTDSFPGPYH